jgi:polygalacturonase
MFKQSACIILSLLCMYIAHAQHHVLPAVPAVSYNVEDFGAKGDGKTMNTVAIQAALDKAKLTGGTVQIPKGQFLCGPLVLYSKTNLSLAEGAILRLRNDIDSFPAEKERYLNFITVSNAADVKISGKGVIDGQGKIWWEKFTAKQITFRRPQMLAITKCDRVEIEGVKFLNPPNTHLSLKNTTEVFIHNITIEAPADSRNTDGINISAKNCTIAACNISTGDDNIAINFGNRYDSAAGPEVQNMLIRDCFFGHGHGLSIGSFTSGGLQHLSVSNCKFEGTTSAIRIKTARGRGGLVEDITYQNISIRDVKWPVFISEYYPKEPATPEADSAIAMNEKTPRYRNIVLKNIKVTGAGDAVKIWGVPESPITGIRFGQVSIAAKTGLQLYNAQDITFTGCDFVIEKGERVKSYQATFTGLP